MFALRVRDFRRCASTYTRLLPRFTISFKRKRPPQYRFRTTVLDSRRTRTNLTDRLGRRLLLRAFRFHFRLKFRRFDRTTTVFLLAPLPTGFPGWSGAFKSREILIGNVFFLSPRKPSVHNPYYIYRRRVWTALLSNSADKKKRRYVGHTTIRARVYTYTFFDTLFRRPCRRESSRRNWVRKKFLRSYLLVG